MKELKIITTDGITIRTEGYTTVDDYDLFSIVNARDVAESNYAAFVKSRGTLDNPKPLEKDDEIFSFFYAGHDNEAAPAWTAELTVGTEGEIKPGIVPGYFAFKVMCEDGVVSTALTVHNDTTVEFNRKSMLEVDGQKCLKIKIGDDYYAVQLTKL